MVATSRCWATVGSGLVMVATSRCWATVGGGLVMLLASLLTSPCGPAEPPHHLRHHGQQLLGDHTQGRPAILSLKVRPGSGGQQGTYDLNGAALPVSCV